MSKMKHKKILAYWLEEHATAGERCLTYDEQCYALQMWLQQEANWRKTMTAMESYDDYGNPPARPTPSE